MISSSSAAGMKDQPRLIWLAGGSSPESLKSYPAPAQLCKLSVEESRWPAPASERRLQGALGWRPKALRGPSWKRLRASWT